MEMRVVKGSIWMMLFLEAGSGSPDECLRHVAPMEMVTLRHKDKVREEMERIRWQKERRAKNEKNPRCWNRTGDPVITTLLTFVSTVTCSTTELRAAL